MYGKTLPVFVLFRLKLNIIYQKYINVPVAVAEINGFIIAD